MFVAIAPAQEKPAAAPEKEAQEAPAPSSVADIIKVLEQYKPDAAAIDKARGSLRHAEATFARISRGPNMQFYHHAWTAALERARAEVFIAEGKMVEAEAALRKTLSESEADAPDRERRTRRGMTQSTDDGTTSYRGLLQRRLASALMNLGRLSEAELNIRGAPGHRQASRPSWPVRR